MIELDCFMKYTNNLLVNMDIILQKCIITKSNSLSPLINRYFTNDGEFTNALENTSAPF